MLNTLLRYEWVFWTAACIATVFLNPADFPFFIALPIFAILRPIAGKPILPDNRLALPIFGLLIMIGVSAAVTPDLPFSFRKIAGLLNGIGLFISLSIAAKEWVNLPTWLLLLFGMLIAGAGALGADIYARIPLLFPLFRFFYRLVPLFPSVGRVLNPNLIAGAMLMTLLPAVGLILSARQKQQPILLIVSAICVCVQTFMLLIMQSRGAIIAASIGTFAIVYLLRPNTRVTMRRFSLGGIFSILLLVLPIWPQAVQEQLQSAYFATLVKGDEGEKGLDSLSIRLQIWDRAATNIKDQPLTGHGMNIFRTIANEPTPILPSGNEIPHAHNWALQIILELGALGLLFYGWLLALAIGSLRNVWKEKPGLRAKTAGVAAALLAFMIFGLLDTISPGARPDFIFWTLLAAAMAA